MPSADTPERFNGMVQNKIKPKKPCQKGKVKGCVDGVYSGKSADTKGQSNTD